MSIKAIEWATNQAVPLSTKTILILLADHLNVRDEFAWPSVEALAARAGISERQVRRHISLLVERGLVRVVEQRGRGRGKGRETNRYALACDARTGAPVPLVTGGHERPPANVVTGGHRRPAVSVTGGHPGRLQADIYGADTIYRTGIEPESLVGEGIERDLLGDPVSKPDKKPTKKPAAKAGAYTPEFQAFWLAWPKARRELSDKRTAFKRWGAALETWDAATIQKAADRYLSLPNVRKEAFRYCKLAEVFLNGSLEAAIEAVTVDAPTPGAKPRRVWSNLYQDFIEE